MFKKIFMLPLLLLVAFTAQSQNDAVARFFSQYAEDERFTSVYISPKMFKMVAKIETNDPEWNNIREVIADLGGLRVLVADNTNDGMSLYKDAMKRLPMNEYEELLTVRDGKENVRFVIRENNNVIQELVLLVGAPDQFVLLTFFGKIDLNKISKLAKTLDVEGVEHLEKVKGKKQ